MFLRLIRIKRFAAALILVLVVLGIAIFLTRPWSPVADVFPAERIEVGGVVRRFRLVVPLALPAAAPVVFAFHGVGDSPGSMAAYSQLDRLAERHGFLLVYPEARRAMWTAHDNGKHDLNANQDAQFFDALLDHLQRRYTIDRRRVYLVGMSNGAAFAQLLAFARPHKIAAVTAHSGARPRDLAWIDRTPPLLLLVGDNDATMPAIRDSVDEYRRRGTEVEFMVAPNLAHAWSREHNEKIWEFLARHTLELETMDDQ